MPWTAVGPVRVRPPSTGFRAGTGVGTGVGVGVGIAVRVTQDRVVEVVGRSRGPRAMWARQSSGPGSAGSRSSWAWSSD